MERRILCFVVFFVLLFTVHGVPVKAQTIHSGWTDTPPTIDGSINPVSEWDAADTESFTMGGYSGTMYVMNDASNLYILVVIQDDENEVSDELHIFFDSINRGSGSVEDGEDGLVIFAVTANPLDFGDIFWDSSIPSWDFDMNDPPGTNDGSGLATQDGANWKYFEFAHPLNSDDDDHDFSLDLGDNVGFTIYWKDKYSPTQFDEFFWPCIWVTPNEYGEIRIAKAAQVPVGGVVLMINKLAVLTPYITTIIIMALATAIIIKKRRH
ncbi:MAG: hypothetical protein OEZ25_06110 [Candidatus Bathyarchaeota archaeon]|nr:hypothetical protein [Candidatus Bathyarchaeota archaeon]